MTLLSYKIVLTYHHFRIVCCSVTKSCPTLCNPYGLQHTRFPCPSPSPKIFSNLCIVSVMPFNHLFPCHPLLLLPSIFPNIWVFSNGSSHQVATVLELQHQSFRWIFRINFIYDWLVLYSCYPRDFQKCSPAPHSKTSVLWYSALFMVQFSHPYMTTGNTMALTILTIVS